MEGSVALLLRSSREGSSLRKFAPLSRSSVACFATSLSLVLLSNTPGRAGQRCLTLVKARTPSVENPAASLSPGEHWGPVTQVRVNKRNGAMSYCAHGDYCYSASGLELSMCIVLSPPVLDLAAKP